MRCVSVVFVLGILAAQLTRGQESLGRSEHGQELIGVSGASSLGIALANVHRIMAWTLPKPPPTEALDALTTLVARSFPVDTTTARIREACDGRYNPSQFDEIIAWFRSPLGLEVAKAERSGAVIDDTRRRQIREQVRAQWVSQRRMLLLGRLDENLGLGLRQGIFALNLLEDLITSLKRDSPPPEEWSDAHIQAKLQEATDRLESRLRDSVLFDMRVTYRSLSNDDLQGYNEFLESYSGRWYVELMRQGLENAFLEGQERFLEGAPQIPSRSRRVFAP